MYVQSTDYQCNSSQHITTTISISTLANEMTDDTSNQSTRLRDPIVHLTTGFAMVTDVVLGALKMYTEKLEQPQIEPRRRKHCPCRYHT